MNRIIEDQASCPTSPGYRRWTENGQPGGIPVAPVCQVWESTGNKRGTVLTTIGKYDENGSQLWFKTYGYPGGYDNIIQTSDGGYLAVGTAEGTRDLKNGVDLAYNPKAGQSNNYFTPSIFACREGFYEKWIATRIDRNGNVLWTYLYGIPPFSTGSMQALDAKGNAYAVIEMDNGKFLIGGAQEDPDNFQTGNSTAKSQRAAIIQIDANGKYEWGEYYLNGASTGGSVHDFQKAIANGISIYVAAGTEGYYYQGSAYDGTTVKYRKKAFLSKVDVGGNHSDDEGVFSWVKYHGFESEVKQNVRVTDIAVNSDGNILFPVIRRTGDGCFNWSCSGDATMYIANPVNGDLVSSIDITDYGNSADNLKAYDLRLGVAPTRDGGFAIVSTVQPNGQLVLGVDVPSSVCGGDISYELEYFETDAFVAKFSKVGNLMWKRSFDAGAASTSPTGPRFGWTYPHPQMLDLKRQECVYSITETSNGSLIISGNTSANFDDYYFAKLTSSLVPILSLLLLQ